MKKSIAILGFATALALDLTAQSEIVIGALDRAGQLVFERVTNAVNYRIDWAPEASGPWTSLTNIPGDGEGTVTAAVPMVYRVVATVTNPPIPDFVVGHSGTSAYLINGQSDPTIELVRGQTYIFDIDSIGHPFWIKTAPTTGIGNLYTNGLSDNGIQQGRITFAVPYDAPSTLYYICQFHSAMQGIISITGGAPAPSGMSLIPAGTFVMGNTFGDGSSDELPLHTNYISAFYVDPYEVTKALWDEVKAYNGGNGYSYYNPGSGKATNHPVHTVNWYDVVKWCNARSEKDGLTPVYYTDAGFTTVYKTGELAAYANWTANGYRLPTEAEWEKAARGGTPGTRFPWTDYTNKISWAKANYYGNSSGYSHDLSGGDGAYHPTFATGDTPYTSPVGYFAPNGYGLYDMAGNVFEWCWDWWHGSYASSPANDPRGPSSGSFRVIRGGSWGSLVYNARVASRGYYNPDGGDFNVGFRCARGL